MVHIRKQQPRHCMLRGQDVKFEALKEPVFLLHKRKDINKRGDRWKQFLCDSLYFFIKSCLSYMSEKQMYGYKSLFKASLLSTSFHKAAPSYFIIVLSLFEITASYVANSSNLVFMLWHRDQSKVSKDSYLQY